jgi:hypothetical protein
MENASISAESLLPVATSVRAAPRPRSQSRHAVKVALRAGGATAVVAGAAYLVAPSVAPLVAIAAAVAILGFELSQAHAAVVRAIAEVGAEVAQTQPLLALAQLLPTVRPLPLMQGYAIAPDCALLLAQLVADERPEVVVETGSGVSTLVLAYALQKLGRGQVFALEHDRAYARETRAELARHGLGKFATVIDAPLEPIAVAGATYRWYATRALEGLPPIDLVVDDGPPRYAGDMLRYASLHVLAPRLSPRATFVLDVVGPEERDVLERWRTELPSFAQHHLETRKGNVIIRRQRES